VLPTGRFGLACVVATVLPMCSNLIQARGSDAVPPAVLAPAGSLTLDFAPVVSLPAPPLMLQAAPEPIRLPPTGNASGRSKLNEATAATEVRGVASPLRRTTQDRSRLASQAAYASHGPYEATVTDRDPVQPQPWGAAGAADTAGPWAPMPIDTQGPRRQTERSWTPEQMAPPPAGRVSVTPPTMRCGCGPQGIPITVQPLPKASWPGNPNRSGGQTSSARPPWTAVTAPRNSWRGNGSDSGSSGVYGGLAARPSRPNGSGSTRPAWTGTPQATRGSQAPPVSPRTTSATWQVRR
jgi:hypothetical protein